MNAFNEKLLIGCVAMSIVAAICAAQDGQVKTLVVGAQPKLLERDQGERRLRRKTGNNLVAPEFVLKISPANNGSEHLVVGSEDLVPGAVIGQHKHLGMEEVVLVHAGSVHATVGEVEGDVNAGGLIFIPSDTWVTIKNISDGPTNIVFIFSHPGFDDYMRCVSVSPEDKNVSLSRQERKDCAHKGHAVFKSLESDPAEN
jgi:quercetin dioxygenase-like cupin family protein